MDGPKPSPDAPDRPPWKVMGLLLLGGVIMVTAGLLAIGSRKGQAT